MFTAGFLFLLLPWSIYASIKSGELVIISTQYGYSLLDGNNEDCFADGYWHWHPEWIEKTKGDPRYLYSRAEYREYSALRKVLIFWFQNRNKLLLLFKRKLTSGFMFNRYFLWTYAALLYYFLVMLGLIMKRFAKTKKLALGTSSENVPVSPLMHLVNIVLVTLITLGEHRFVEPYMYFILLPAAYLPFYILKFSRGIFRGAKF